MAKAKITAKVVPAIKRAGPPGEVTRTAAEQVSDAIGSDLTKVAGPTDDEAAEETVTMVFPKKLILTRDNHTFVSFNAGINEVPTSLADHWWLKANGVLKHEK